MPHALVDELSPLTRAACAYAPRSLHAMMTAAFAFDERLAATVGRVREPALAQLRIAWWRDRLGETVARRPVGDPVLDGLGTTWEGGEAALLALADGWERMVGEAPFAEEDISEFAAGRAALFAGIAERARLSDFAPVAATHGRRFAYGDLAAGRGRNEMASAPPPTGRLAPLPRTLRPLAVLSGLATRSLRRGGGPLLGDRGSPAVLIRLGLFGR